jgi:hypothetical protein
MVVDGNGDGDGDGWLKLAKEDTSADVSGDCSKSTVEWSTTLGQLRLDPSSLTVEKTTLCLLQCIIILPVLLTAYCYYPQQHQHLSIDPT